MKKLTYSEKLKDPRWQKRRLELLEAASWTCRICESKTRTLHVHHKYYKRGSMPWEYPDNALLVLCEDCHDMQQDFMEAAHQFVAEYHLDFSIARCSSLPPRVKAQLSDTLRMVMSMAEDGFDEGRVVGGAPE